MSSLSRMVKLSVLRNPSLLQRPKIRAISTSNKKDDTTVAVGPSPKSEEAQPEPKVRFFYDYGFAAGFYYLYRPDQNMHDWAKREAYLELRRREELGLPPIDPNYVDPSTIYLPSDEELGETEVII